MANINSTGTGKFPLQSRCYGLPDPRPGRQNRSRNGSSASSRTIGCFLAVALVGLSTSCDDQQIKVYQVPKNPQGTTNANSVNPSREPRLAWEAPAEWESVPPGPMRLATFIVRGASNRLAEISIVGLKGHSGDDLENFNRWRAQVGLPPADAQELHRCTRQIEIGGIPGNLIEIGSQSIDGQRASRLLVATLQKGEITWFFKIVGDDELVTAQKPVFTNFLSTVRYAD